MIKTHAAVERMAPQIQAAVDAAHGGGAAFDIRPMSDYVSDSVGDTRFLLFVLAAFAGASVLLAAVGLYGTLAYLTAQRTREFGIRLALGSSVKALVTIVIRESVLLAGVGAAVGLVGVAAVTRAIGQLLYGVRPLDGVTLAGVVGLLANYGVGSRGCASMARYTDRSAEIVAERIGTRNGTRFGPANPSELQPQRLRTDDSEYRERGADAASDAKRFPCQCYAARSRCVPLGSQGLR